MASVHLSAPPTLQFFDNAGRLNAGGSILTQVGGVNYPTYQDSAGSVALPNPIPLNSRGEISNAAGASQSLFLVDGVIYVFTLYDANSNVLDTFSYMVGTSTSADISNLQSQITAFATSFTTGTLTVTGSSTLSTLSVGAITGTGAVNIGSNTLTCGAVTAGAVTCGAITSTGNESVTGNITATGTISGASFSTTAPNAASFLSGSPTTTGNLVNVNNNGTSTGSGITVSAGTITLAAVGTYDVTFSGIFKNPTAATNIDTGIYFGGTANVIVGPVTGNAQRMEIAGANGAVYGYASMRAIVVTNAINQTLTVNSTLGFSGTYQAEAGCYITVSQR